MTRQYKLVNTNRGNELIRLMHDHIHYMLTDVFKLPEEFNLEGDDYVAMYDQLLDEHNINLDSIERFNSQQSTYQLNNYLTDDTLTADEAIFCILGLDINSTPYNFSIFNMGKHKNNIVLDSVICHTSEYRKLNKAIIAEEYTDLSLIKERYIHTDKFIFWAIDKGFIEEANTKLDTGDKPNAGNINTYHNKERASIANHNKEMALEAYEAWAPALGAPRNPNTFTNDSMAWTELELKLEPLLKEDDAGNRVMPKKETIAQYIRDDINSKKS